MGSVSIRIDINQDQATIAFMAQNASVRDALEASIPKLRDMLSTQQIKFSRC
jgi:flagellar hook-length control protein FliK